MSPRDYFGPSTAAAAPQVTPGAGVDAVWLSSHLLLTAPILCRASGVAPTMKQLGCWAFRKFVFEAFRKFVQTFGCKPFTARFFHSSLEPGCLSERELKRTCAHSGEFLQKIVRHWGLSLQEGPVEKLRIGAIRCAVRLEKRNYFSAIELVFLFKSVGFRGSSLSHI